MPKRKVLMKGNEAYGEAAVRAGCRFYFGYPITPQTEVAEYLSRRLPEVGGVFLQAESEIASVNMLYGAAAAGARAMTSTSGLGLALMQEGISYLAGAELPAVIVNTMRGGPGIGNIAPAQADYRQAVKGGGNGDYRTIVLAPTSVPEIFPVMELAFNLADRYRNPVIVLSDGMIGQMMEPVEIEDDLPPLDLPEKPWATTGTMGRRPKNVIKTDYLEPEELERHNLRLAEKYARIEAEEQRWKEFALEDAELVLVAFGTMARLAQAAAEVLRSKGIAASVLAPITLYPFPIRRIRELADDPGVRGFLTVEMSLGQLVEDVRLAVEGRKPVSFFGRTGGVVPTLDEIVAAAESVAEERGVRSR